ncbi:MAG: restriction endonuclease subunit S [Proteobacteria bacterium]|nr:restriction endonuclease subunit S [Pseudomonadota bacterium]
MSEPTHSPFSRYQLAELAAPGSDTFVDGPFGSSLKSHEYVDAGVRLIQLQNIGEGEWRDENKKFITPRKFKTLERHGAVPGDIAIAKMADPVARACLVPPVSEQFVVVADCMRLRLDESRFDSGYVVRSINSPYTRREAENKAIGSTRVRINLSVLKTVGCLAPALPEQREITRILDTLDTAIHETEAIIAKLRAVKEGLLHDLLTRGIDDNGELRPPQSEAPHLYKESPLGWIPKTWNVVALGTVLSEPPRNGLYKPPHLIGRGALLVGQTAFAEEGSVKFEMARRAQVGKADIAGFGLQACDLLVSRVFATLEGVGRPVIVPDPPEPAVYESNMMRMRAKAGVVTSTMMFNLLKLPVSRAAVRSRAFLSNQASINRQGICSIELALPPWDEQVAIDTRVKALTDRLEHEVEMHSKYRAEKTGLMDDLLTGRVRVTPLLESAAK